MQNNLFDRHFQKYLQQKIYLQYFRFLAFIIYPITFFVTLNVPIKFVSITWLKSSFFILIRSISFVMPALFTRTSIEPNSSITFFVKFSQSSKFDTSPFTNKHFTLFSSICFFNKFKSSDSFL